MFLVCNFFCFCFVFCCFRFSVGNALLFLLPAEESYVEFISINQKVWKWLDFLLFKIDLVARQV